MQEVILLALETSGRSGSVAILSVSGECMQCESELLDANAGSARTLAPAIHRLLTRRSLHPSDLTAIAVITGPGSFTGLRVGVATAKAMAYALRLPTIEVDSLDTIAYQIPISHPNLHVVLDAYRGQVFYARYSAPSLAEAQNLRYAKATETQILNIDTLLNHVLPQHENGREILVCGPGCSRIRKYLGEPANLAHDNETGLSRRIDWRDGADSAPHAESVARLGHAKLTIKQTQDAFHLNPHYFRASAAEELSGKTRHE